MTRVWIVLLLFCLLCAARPLQGQDPLKTLPRNYWKVFENAEVTVIHAHYGAREKIATHDHGGEATVFVYLNDSSAVRIVHVEDGHVEDGHVEDGHVEDGHVEDAAKAHGAAKDSVVRPPTVTGAFRVVPGMAERHSIENLGDKPSDFLRIELKGRKLGVREGFRGAAPETLEKDMDTIAFFEPGLRVERIVCAKASACAVKPAEWPSLLIAVSGAELTGGAGAAAERLGAGEVRWMQAGDSFAVSSSGGSARQLLRLLLPAGR